MAEPIKFRIVQDLQTSLRAISIAGGYHNDVAAIAVKLDPDAAIEAIRAPGAPRPLLLIQVNPERRAYEPSYQVREVLPVVVHWVQDSDATDDESRMRTFFRGCADVEQAIAPDDGGPGRSRGGLTIDTLIRQCVDREDLADGAEVWAQIEIDIPLLRNYGRPNG